MITYSENKNKYISFLITLGIVILLFLLFIFVRFIVPNPPFPEKKELEIEIGLGDEGFGENAGGSGLGDPDLVTTPNNATPQLVNNTAPNIVADPTEETPVVVKTNPNSTATTEQLTPEEQKASEQLLKALTALKTKKEHKGKGDGNGNTGGSGNGTGVGVGDGNNPSEGNDPNGGSSGKGGYDLKGRQLVKKPARMTDTDEEGVVVVEIIVDENGKVKRATPGQRGSTTTSANLYAKARLAAYEAKFSPSPDGTTEQRGTYTFVFTLE